jgi:hypothetical protein
MMSFLACSPGGQTPPEIQGGLLIDAWQALARAIEIGDEHDDDREAQDDGEPTTPAR